VQHHHLSASEMPLFNVNWELTFFFFCWLICLYFTLIGPLRMRFSQSWQVPVWKIALFVSGVLLYWGAMASPLAELAHQSFTGHMAQMTVLYLVKPPILLLGLPGWMLQPLFKRKEFTRFFLLPPNRL
jgi:putative membrane protein